MEAEPRLARGAESALDVTLRLVDAAGAPVSGADVSLEGFAVARSGDRQQAVATTDAAGAAILRMPRGRAGRAPDACELADRHGRLAALADVPSRERDTSMEVMWIVLPVALGIAAMAVLVFAWAVRADQFDDLVTPSLRILVDDEPGRTEREAQPAVLDRIGNTPLERIDGVFVKLECSNPFGSVKDRIARFMLLEAMRRGELKVGDTVVEATSGNTGIALAAVARELGLKAVIFMPEHMSVERVRMIESLGAEIRLTPREESFAGACARRDELKGLPGHFVPDQFGNPDNVRCHRETTGREIVEQLAARGVEKLDAFVAGVGTGGTLMGIGQALRAAHPGLRVIAVEPGESAVMSGGEAGEHGIQGIGDGFIPALMDMSFVTAIARVSTDEAHAEAQRIHEVHGFCVGRSAGANLLVARRLAAAGQSVVTAFPDCSDRYLSLGLESPESKASTCPHAPRCARR